MSMCRLSFAGRHFKLSIVTAAVSAALCVSASQTAFAQVSTDVFDQSQGGTIISSSPTIAGFEATGIIGGITSGEGGTGRTIFTDIGPNLVTIGTAGPVTLTGVNLFTLTDQTPPGTTNRGTASFSFFADADNNGSFETLLVNGVNPVDTGVANTYLFSAITASRFQASFTGNVGATFTGPRIVELDAIGTPAPVPEPGEWATISLAATSVVGLMLRARRRKTAKA